MSNIANWAYTNVATIRPFVSRDQWSGEATYGEEYEIACTWKFTAERVIDGSIGASARGIEFISKYMVWTEDLRPKRLDMIRLAGHPNFDEIRSRVEDDMSFFDTNPDVTLVT